MWCLESHLIGETLESSEERKDECQLIDAHLRFVAVYKEGSGWLQCRNCWVADGVPISPSSDSLTDAWRPTLHKFRHNKLFVDYVVHSSFAYRQFNNNFTRGDPTILPYELIHSRSLGTIGHEVGVASP
ncbi:hypothetical protein AVEN_209223-1 [Araneus ventricosus]|uniref:Uncharacterized protein n=1 Tax=Araneus ventricosus TaxID=182803 RepID=A0A4Y2M1K5_ARAVE|nr:hypothetical protein AVEN_209223-1 [Araneus ventricosus]